MEEQRDLAMKRVYTPNAPTKRNLLTLGILMLLVTICSGHEIFGLFPEDENADTPPSTQEPDWEKLFHMVTPETFLKMLAAYNKTVPVGT